VLLVWFAGALALATFAAYRKRVWTATAVKPELVL
jgi:putative membrane protein